MSTLAFHFVRLVKGVPKLRDGRPVPPVGEWLVHEGEIRICEAGLHASKRAIDALNYLEWPDAAACVVECDEIDESQSGDDKFVCRRRRVLGWAPCDDLLHFAAREFALSVASHWDMPTIVREYLKTGDEDKRDAAWAAARDAAWAAARDAAWAAARDAAWAAARAAARDAAWATARDAAGDAENALLESLIVDACGVDLS